MAQEQYFTYIYYSAGGTGTFQRGLYEDVYGDQDDGGGDDLEVFGDIPNDNGRFGMEYYGTTADGELVTYNSFTGDQWIWSNTDHGSSYSPTVTTGGTYQLVCYASGAFIATDAGDVAVEDLSAGDRVVTASGETKAVKWVGSRSVDLTQPQTRAAQPIVIRADAFGDSAPHADLRVSPDHAMAMTVQGRQVLVPARMLLNGATVVRDAVDEVTYWHVELEGGHDLLLANGAPSESYLDAGNRGFFAGEGDVLPNDTTANDVTYCLPIAGEAEVAAIRRGLEAQAEALGYTPDRAPRLTLSADGAALDVVLEAEAATAGFDAGCDALVLSTDVVRPSEWAGDDTRALGLAIHSLVIADARGVSRVVPLSDARLRSGLLPCDGGGSRWTRRSLKLPSSLWAGMKGRLSIRIGFNTPEVRRWAAPAAAA